MNNSKLFKGSLSFAIVLALVFSFMQVARAEAPVLINVKKADSVKITPIKVNKSNAKNPKVIKKDVKASAATSTRGEGQCLKADFNSDGKLNVFDFLAFQTAYGNEDKSANVNGDKVIDEADFEMFLKLWSDCNQRLISADFNSDGKLNVFDFLAFQTAYGNEDKRADMNADGKINFADFKLFFEIWMSYFGR